MSTPSSCRREEVANCQPDKTHIIKDTPAEKPHGDKECASITERQFMRDHTIYSAISSWLFAIAGATNIGVLCAFSSKVLMAAEQGKPIFTSADPAVKPVMGNKLYNRIALGMMAFGGACMAVSNWLESKKVVTEWQLGAGKLQRKAHIVEANAEAKEPALKEEAAMPAQSDKQWTQSIQSEPVPSLERA